MLGTDWCLAGVPVYLYILYVRTCAYRVECAQDMCGHRCQDAGQYSKQSPRGEVQVPYPVCLGGSPSPVCPVTLCTL